MDWERSKKEVNNRSFVGLEILTVLGSMTLCAYIFFGIYNFYDIAVYLFFCIVIIFLGIGVPVYFQKLPIFRLNDEKRIVFSNILKTFVLTLFIISYLVLVMVLITNNFTQMIETEATENIFIKDQDKTIELYTNISNDKINNVIIGKIRNAYRNKKIILVNDYSQNDFERIKNKLKSDIGDSINKTSLFYGIMLGMSIYIVSGKILIDWIFSVINRSQIYSLIIAEKIKNENIKNYDLIVNESAEEYENHLLNYKNFYCMWKYVSNIIRDISYENTYLVDELYNKEMCNCYYDNKLKIETLKKYKKDMKIEMKNKRKKVENIYNDNIL